MPRGKNYVNQGKGMHMKSHAKAQQTMEECLYGAGCTRSDCIYRHPAKGSIQKSHDPCLPFLAGLCEFTAAGCRKRHPREDEAARLVAKYKTVPCRFGADCKTIACMYNHEQQVVPVVAPSILAFPPLSLHQQHGNSWRPPNGNWKPNPPRMLHPPSTVTPPQGFSSSSSLNNNAKEFVPR
jgi:hypothetical protein